MNVCVDQIVLPKKGNSTDECEDSICIYHSKKGKPTVLKFAIADGATESSFSKEWANLLTSTITGKSHISKGTLQKILPILQSKWNKDVLSRPLPYYAEMKAAQGAFSTFIGLQLNRNTLKYKCLAVGDCCFFHVRNSEIIKSFPIIDSSEFGNNPFLISSKQSQNAELSQHIKETEGDFKSRDILFLMSDAISHWFLNTYQLNTKPWEILKTHMIECQFNPSLFQNWLNSKRMNGEMKNDDISVITIDIT